MLADTVQLDEFHEAQRAIINAQVDNFASNHNIAQVFLFLDRYKFPADFFDRVHWIWVRSPSVT